MHPLIVFFVVIAGHVRPLFAPLSFEILSCPNRKRVASKAFLELELSSDGSDKNETKKDAIDAKNILFMNFGSKIKGGFDPNRIVTFFQKRNGRINMTSLLAKKGKQKSLSR